MLRKFLLLCGVIAPLVYVFTVILGGAIRPGYNHLAHTVSGLTEAGVPDKLLLDILFSLYNIILAVFGLGLLLRIRESQTARGRGNAGVWTLVIIGLLGLAMSLFFPMDPRGAPVTLPCTMHLVLAGLLSLSSMLVLLLTGLWLRQDANFKPYGTYTLVSCVFIFLSGGIAAATAATASPFMGLAERVTIGAFIQWILVMGVWLSTGGVGSREPEASRRG